MSYQERVLAGVQLLSRGRTAWERRPLKRLPSRVDVTLETGRVAKIEMRHARGANWARLIDDQKTKVRPSSLRSTPRQTLSQISSYHESTTSRPSPHEHEDLLVAEHPAFGAHILLRSDSNFETKRASPEAAAGRGTPRGMSHSASNRAFATRVANGRKGHSRMRRCPCSAQSRC